MVFDFMMARGLTGPSVTEFISRDRNVTSNPNKYNSFRSGREKVENNVNSLDEGVGEETLGNV